MRLHHIARSRPLGIAVPAIIEAIIGRYTDAIGGTVAITLYIRTAAERAGIKLHITHFCGLRDVDRLVYVISFFYGRYRRCPLHLRPRYMSPTVKPVLQLKTAMIEVCRRLG